MMTVFEPGSSGDRSNCSAKCSTTTAFSLSFYNICLWMSGFDITKYHFTKPNHNSNVCVKSMTRQIVFGSVCGTIGRAVVSDTRGLWIESNHPDFRNMVFCKLY